MTHRTHPFSPATGRRSGIFLLVLAAALALGGCDRRGATGAAPPAEPISAPGGSMRMKQAGEAREQQAPPSAGVSTDLSQGTPLQRYLAVRQDLNVQVPPEQLADAWGKVRDLCGTLQCELLSSSLLRETPQQPGNAMLEMRVAPADVDKLLSGLAGVANVVSQNTTSEDKTAEVIDVEARIKNRVEFRDSLRLMLRDKTTKRDMSDLLEIQRTLADTQAELDSSATQRKVLEQQTTKQHIQIQFTPTRTLSQGGRSYNPMVRALREAGSVLAESVGMLITFLAAVLPWLLLVGLPVVWLVRLVWRRRRAKAA
ncbi:DUF4349 domain-containing protein [Variovorax sp. 770b2]|jgi:hypothetical protein|uniref:DUF4349 domain-containing protein n=1 Tax=Variovorax sp. 770b2 TaxID=1566271 RepID=UPI0008ED2AB1|nr:DUF4349 domain-containing protein [Variovorax sp. 770b2]SFQ29893.1 protein of unknown function [Variovorax sp. 770b2]